MTPFWEDSHLQLWGGDCREVLRSMPDESVHMVCTSPPYWGLRDYGTAAWDGGDAACDHRGGARRQPQRDNSGGLVNNRIDSRGEQSWTDGAAQDLYRETCGKCGARRIDSQLGLEATPEEFVANMVGVFREVRRVLRRDGTLWLNLGDSYFSASSTGNAFTGGMHTEVAPETQYKLRDAKNQRDKALMKMGYKAKDLVGIPWRVAFALQADGWYLRSDIIWAKPNPMPESVTDRPTKAHEYLFLLTRSPRYYYDAEAVREAESPNTASFVKMKERFVGERHEAKAAEAHAAKADDVNDRRTTLGFYGPQKSTGFRNLRSVWNIATEPYPGAHFATFPRKLVEPCVKAGTSERGVCPECGAPWVRVVERESRNDHGVNKTPEHLRMSGPRGPSDLLPLSISGIDVTTTGWRPSCGHGSEPTGMGREPDEPYPAPVPAVVLDPFAGSGTTLFVAQALGRRGVGIDLSPDYLKQALDRNRQTPLGLVG